VRLQGVHHITAITADAPRNLDFYARGLGLRLVKKTVNFDAPDYYHLYYGAGGGEPGSVLTFFEFPDAVPGSAGAGMIHTIIWRVRDEEALAFWADRLSAEGVSTTEQGSALLFADPEGLALELAVVDTHDPPLAAAAPEIPAEHALLGFEGVRAYGRDLQASHRVLTDALGFTAQADTVGHRLRGGEREALYHLDPAPETTPVQGAGTVHHIAWASADADHAGWRERVIEARLYPTEIIDRLYFRSIYFREPSGVLFEIATLGPGFAVDEPLDRLGESLQLPPQHEHLRARLERALTPVSPPWTPARVGAGERAPRAVGYS
jgi:glyoxalase family protein